MVQPELTDIRLSAIWCATKLNLLNDTPDPARPLSALGQRISYEKLFRQVAEPAGPDQRQPYTLPWPPDKRHYFWRYYLHQTDMAALNFERLWKLVVPLRQPGQGLVLPASTRFKLRLERFYYPHGVAVVASASWRFPTSLGEATDQLLELWRGTAALHPEGHSPLTLETLAQRDLGEAQRVLYGEATAETLTIRPFTIITVVAGTGVTGDQPLAHGSALHRALEAMTGLRPVSPDEVLSDLATTSIGARGSAPGSILYGKQRGRAIWFPHQFASQGKRQTSLGCYHRNLTLASMQVESLGELIRCFLKLRPEQAPFAIHDYVRNATLVLTRLFKGDDTTYRSSSIRAQILQNHLEQLDAARLFYRLKPIIAQEQDQI